MAPKSTRLDRLRRLVGREADTLLLTHLPNLLYLAGFRGSSGVLAVNREAAVLFVPGLYRLQAQEEVQLAQVEVAPDPLQAAAAWVRRSGATRVAFEDQNLTVARLEQVRRVLGPGVELVAGRRWVESLREVKEPEEIARIKHSLKLTARVFEETLPYIRPGVMELELAAEIDFRIKQHGGQGAGFETIVASGPRAALPHGRATRKRLAKNELVILDLGAILEDYHSDMTRTVYLGTPPARVKRIYRAVREALERARRAVRAGVPASRIDAAARACLKRRGLAGYFVHGTGHGLGLEIHEGPRIARGVNTPLAAGNVITLEPGVYIPGWGGVRIEDVVVVRRQSVETLTPLSAELLCL